ncbi:MAG: site-specific integrase [Candidatus Thiodiazotropha sp. (ex Lucinoma kastoroae)]|nr:site-specific integrase [Candidatus Thiodiazotropha sp. (ex Lucinoma kastoroae)]
MTNTINFIDSVIRNLKPQNKRTVYWCNGCPGFGLRVTSSGTKTFVYKYMNGRQSRWLTIGKYPEWSIRKARNLYDQYYEEVNDYGRDPIAEIHDIKTKEKSRISVAEFLTTYLDTGRIKGKTRLNDEESAFKRDILPVIGDKYLDEVTSEDIDIIQNNILAREKAKNKNNKNTATTLGKSSVRHTLSYIRQFFELAKTKHKYITSNPVDEVDALGSSSVRERVLDFKEIWLFWNNIENIGRPPVLTASLKFLLATMQRSTEVRHMTYDSYKEDEATWHMKVEDTKNRQMHRVPLNKHALELLETVKPFTCNSPYIFGATKAHKAPDKPKNDLVPFGITAFPQAINKNREKLGIDDFTPHDLRRTGATWITAVGLPKLYASLLLNHKDGNSDITGQVYVQYAYDFEKKRAVNVWEFILDQIIECEDIDDVPDLDTMRKLIVESGLLNS